VKAIAKSRPAPGLTIVEADEPQIRAGHVKVRVERGSICGTDLHIANWDAWSASRMTPPVIVGHEFCGTVVETGEGVEEPKKGDFVASESHIVCGQCKQCQMGQAHVCVNTSILGVDVDGGWAGYAVIPAANARPTPGVVPRAVASMLDALGNAVHTVMAGPVEGRSVLVTGMGPIGLFSVAICKTLGASRVVATEVAPYRIALAERLGAGAILNPAKDDVDGALSRIEPGGFDVALEMSGHPGALVTAIKSLRPGGRLSLLGVYPDLTEPVPLNQVIFKGLDVQGIVGRRLPETWDQMRWLLTERSLDVTPVITHEMPYTEVEAAMAHLRAGTAGKIVLDFSQAAV
jgi:threonine 3-dehydrogenase